MSVEKISNEGEVEFGISGYKRSRGKELAAVKAVSVLQYLFRTLEKVSGLEGAAAAEIWSQLVKKNSVIVAFFDVRREVCYSIINFSRVYATELMMNTSYPISRSSSGS